MSTSLNSWFETMNLDGQFYKELVENPKLYVLVSTIFAVCLMVSSLLLILGAIQVCNLIIIFKLFFNQMLFQCRTIAMYPFVICYFLYIVELIVYFWYFMLFFKVKGASLAFLILYWNLGFFFIRKTNLFLKYNAILNCFSILSVHLGRCSKSHPNN